MLRSHQDIMKYHITLIITTDEGFARVQADLRPLVGAGDHFEEPLLTRITHRRGM
jgi:hypothetical protein